MASIKFPQSVPNQEKSIYWFKRITSYVVSTILYVRQFFDEESFATVKYESTKLRILSKKSKNKNVLNIIDYLEDSFKALERNHLKSITMGIFEMSENGLSKNAVEVYTFNYENATFNVNKPNNQQSSGIGGTSTKRNFKEDTSKTLKNLLESLRAMKQLPGGSYYLLLKLQYFDSFEPKAEGIRHFSELTDSVFDESNFTINDNVETASLSSGSISSNYHMISIHMEADMLNIDKDKLPANLKEQIYVPDSDAEEEESEKESVSSEIQLQGRQPWLGKGLLNKRKLCDDSDEDEGYSMAKRRFEIPQSDDDEDDTD